MKGTKRCFLVGHDADDVLCCLTKVGVVGYPGEVEVIWEELDRVRMTDGCC